VRTLFFSASRRPVNEMASICFVTLTIRFDVQTPYFCGLPACRDPFVMSEQKQNKSYIANPI